MALDFSPVDHAIASALRQIAPAFASAQSPPVDTGELRDSLTSEIDEDGKRLTLSWSAPYALTVHEGYTTSSGTVVEPQRWTQDAIAEFDLENAYGSALGALLNG